MIRIIIGVVLIIWSAALLVFQTKIAYPTIIDDGASLRHLASSSMLGFVFGALLILNGAWARRQVKTIARKRRIES